MSVEDISKDQLNKKRVLKNTVMLYVRMFLLMVIGFVATRVVLRSLGEVDYGLNNAIGGFVALFGILTGSLNAAISRFLTYEMGRKDQENLNRVFSTSIIIQFIMALVVAILVETIGIWFLENYMTIPVDRVEAAHWVLHFAVINTFINLTFIPYSAAIISHEKMNIYAYLSLIEGGLHLGIAYLIATDLYPDRLVFYSGGMCLASIIVNFIYRIYCSNHFIECRIRGLFDKNLLKRIGSFAGWNLIGAGSGILKAQGVNVLFNMFFGPVINAAQGISNQASGLSTKFSNGFTTALNPQITKSFASGDFKYMYSLVYQGSRMSFFLYILIALPVFIETEGLLTFWLVRFPEHTIEFVRIVLITILVDNVLANPLVTIMLATGNIRNYQLVVGGIQLFAFPLAYIMMKNGMSSEMVLVMIAIIAISCMISRVYMLHRMINFPVLDYLQNVIFVLAKVLLVASILPVLTHFFLSKGMVRLLLVCIIALFSVVVSMWFCGFTRSEKRTIINKAEAKIPFVQKMFK